MIKSFQVIQSIGTFSNYRPKSRIEFGNNTIIYALNGYGKSTIVAILKSLGKDVSLIVTERKSLRTEISQAQEIVISHELGTSQFKDDGWKHGWQDKNNKDKQVLPQILVFDQQFVYENLFVERVDSDQKQNIHKIVIGSEGLAITQTLTEAKEQEKLLKKQADDKEKDLIERQKRTKRDGYLNIKNSEKQDMEIELNNINKQITAKEEEEKLRKSADLNLLEQKSWDILSKIRDVYSISFESVHVDAERQVKHHIQKHLAISNTAEPFIRQALDQIVDTCPFCGQSLDNAENLIRAYRRHFDEVYRQSIENIRSCSEELSEWNPSTEILLLKNECKAIVSAIQCIGSYVSVESLQTMNFDDIVQRTESSKTNIRTILGDKLNNISFLPPENDVQYLETILSDINSHLQLINESYKKAKEDVTNYLSAISTVTKEVLNSRKIQIEECLKRFSAYEENWCEEYKKLQVDYNMATSHVEELTGKLSEYSTTVFKDYQADINKVLDDLGVDFRLDRLIEQVDNRSKQPFAEFQIVINGVQVPLQSRKDGACFQNTLSEGEKNTLSFAFFINWIRKQKDLKNNIVIFDDPLSSLDDQRKNLTARMIRDLSKSVKQTIILTHNKDFLLLLYEKLPSPVILSLKKDKKNGSCIVEYKVDELRKEPQHKRIDDLTRYLDEDHCKPEIIQEMIRPCLETALRFKYFRYVNKIPTLGKMLDELQKLGKLDTDHLQILRDLNEISSVPHHGEQQGLQPLKEISRDELLPDVRKTLEILEKI